MKSLAITGIGTVCPLGNSPEELFAGLEAHRHGFVEVPLAELPDCRCRFAARVTEFDSSRFIPPLRARRLDRASLFALGAAHQAISASRLDDPEPLGERMGVVLGTSSAGAGPVTAFLRPLFAQSPEAAPPFEFPNTVANAPASYISIELKLQGPNTTLAHKQSAMAPVLLYTSLLLEDGSPLRLRLSLEAELASHSRRRLVFNALVDGGHHAAFHQLLDDIYGRHAQ